MGGSAGFDFHLHPLWSYAAAAPVEEYCRLARESNIKTVAMTDHHIFDVREDVKSAGALVFIALFASYFRQNDLSRMDSLRKILQLDGIGCAHNIVPDELAPFCREYRLKRKLLSTAGSNCHLPEGQNCRFCPEYEITAWRDEIAERVQVCNK